MEFFQGKRKSKALHRWCILLGTPCTSYVWHSTNVELCKRYTNFYDYKVDVLADNHNFLKFDCKSVLEGMSHICTPYCPRMLDPCMECKIPEHPHRTDMGTHICSPQHCIFWCWGMLHTFWWCYQSITSAWSKICIFLEHLRRDFLADKCMQVVVDRRYRYPGSTRIQWLIAGSDLLQLLGESSLRKAGRLRSQGRWIY